MIRILCIHRFCLYFVFVFLLFLSALPTAFAPANSAGRDRHPGLIVADYTTTNRVADLAGSIECSGKLPQWSRPLPPFQGIRNEPPHLQTICAKTLYGGNRHFNLGAFCGSVADAEIVFDISGTAFNRELIRHYLLCNAKCYCRAAFTRFTRTAFYPQLLSDPIYGLNLHENTVTRNPIRVSDRPPFAPLIRLKFTNQAGPGTLRPNGRVERVYVKATAGFPPFCTGPLPDFQLPMPFDTYPFLSNNALCVATMFGGSPSGNAGATCIELSDGIALWFYPEWSPFVLSNSNYPRGLILALHCVRYCACPQIKDPLDPENSKTTDPSSKPSATPLPWLKDCSADFSNGGMAILIGRGEDSRYIELIPPSTWNNRNSQSARSRPRRKNSCATDSRLCNQDPWPKGLPRPISWLPLSLEETEQDVGVVEDLNKSPEEFEGWTTTSGKDSLFRSPQQPSTCGGPCAGVLDCYSPSSSQENQGLEQSCSCLLLPSMDETKAFGLDPVVPQAVCVASAAVMALARTRHKHLSGRGLGDWSDSGPECVCNQSFVGFECCGSSDGLVWETRDVVPLARLV